VAKNKKGKSVKAHHLSRSQRFINTMFLWRHSSVNDGADNYGWLAPIPAHKKPYIIDLAVYSPNHWHVMAIVFCETQDGAKYRGFADYRTEQAFAARHIADNDDQLGKILQAVMLEAESDVNANHVVDRAIIIRPWSRAYPSMQPVLERLKDRLGISEEDTKWEAA